MTWEMKGVYEKLVGHTHPSMQFVKLTATEVYASSVKMDRANWQSD